mgnify:FL=1
MGRPRRRTDHLGGGADDSRERANRRVYSLGAGAGPGDIPGKAWGVPDVDAREAEEFLARKARVKRAESGECRIVLRRSPGVRVYAAATAAVDTFLLLALFFPAAADAVKAAASAAAGKTFLILPYLFLALYVFNPVAYLWSLNALRHRTVLSRSGIEVRTLVRKERLPWPATRSGFGVLEHVAKRTSGASSHGYQLVLVKGTSDDVVRLPGGRFDTEKGSPHEKAGRAEAATRQTGGAKRPVSDATTRADGAAWQADGAETRADDAATRLADTDNPKIQARLALEGIWSVASRHGWIPNRGSAKADPALIRARTGQGAHRENANRENAHRTNRENSARGFQGRSANRRGRASERGGRAGNRADGRADRLVFGGPDFRRAIEAARDDEASVTWVAAALISVGALGLWLTLGSAAAAKAALSAGVLLLGLAVLVGPLVAEIRRPRRTVVDRDAIHVDGKPHAWPDSRSSLFALGDRAFMADRKGRAVPLLGTGLARGGFGKREAKAAAQCEQIWLWGAANGVVRESGRYTPLRNADWQTEREIASVRAGTR